MPLKFLHFGFLTAMALVQGVMSADVRSNGVYNSSTTPSSLPWDTYNYCNAPHVNAVHYDTPKEDGARLVYLNMMMRHHKRTPDNLYPDENALNPPAGWDCADINLLQYAAGTVPIIHDTNIPASHPFLSMIWNGSCDEGQLTKGGLDDAMQHGKDFWGVYHDKLSFLDAVDEKELWVRTSTEPRTQHVAGGLLFGMDPALLHGSFTVHTQPSPIDSLVPSYPCPAADAIRDAYQSVPAWTDHLNANADLKARLDAILGTAGLADWASWYDHFFDTFTSRTCHGHPLPCNTTTGACVAQDDADRVFAIGDFEYNYIWNTAVNASTYNSLTFGAMLSELAANFGAFKDGKEDVKARVYVGHDGSLVRLASALGFGVREQGRAGPGLRWPAMGSEVVMEVWEARSGSQSVRVIHEGTPVRGLEALALDEWISALTKLVPDDLFDSCMAGS